MMDFDNVKENIQPLATGRNASILQAALNVDMQEELSKQRESLENAISKYKGNDPLQPWFDYVSWIEQSYPSGGSESGLKKVLLKCLENFETDQRYFQDIRLIRIYIKFIDSEENPQELYQELFNAGIGTMVADFYICWAYYYDIIGNFKKADIIFRKGIELRAEPYDQLIEAHRNFGFTMSQRMLYQDERSKVEFLASLQNRRQALTSLRGLNAGSIRLENQIKTCNSGNFQTSSAMGKCSSRKVGVLEDNPYIAVPEVIESSKSIVRNIIECTRKQENSREPGPWSKRSSKKHGNLFKGTNLNNDVLGFTILEDDLSMNLDNSVQDDLILSPLILKNNFKRRIQLPLNFVSKNDPQETWNVKTVLDDGSMPKAIPAYRKNYHYPKLNHEFSMEEYLAYKWFKKRSITNKFIEDCNKFWGDEYSVGIRLYLNFASKSAPDNDKLVLKQENFKLSENLILAVNCNKLYPDDNNEMQFEEILCEKWRNSNWKRKYNIDNTIIAENDVDETFTASAVCKPIRKSNVQPKHILPFIYEEENNSPVNVKLDFENENILRDSDYLAPNESCTTNQFNLFIKAQSISTPIRKPINIIYQNEEKNGFELSPPTPLAVQESQNIFPVKQLSTILETSESNIVKKSSLDTLFGNIDFDRQEFSKMLPSNVPLINIDQQLFTESECDNKPIGEQIKNRLFEKETPTFLLNSINFFEEKTENVSEKMIHRQTNIEGYDTDILNFFAKTPEKKYNSILNKDDYTVKNHSIKNPNFEDLSFPTFSDIQNICQASKISDDFFKSEKSIINDDFFKSENSIISDDFFKSEKSIIPFSFQKDIKVNAHSEQIPSSMNKLLISVKSELSDNCSILSKNICKGNFAPHIYSVIERNETEDNILNGKSLKRKEDQNYEKYNFLRLQNLFNKSNIIDCISEKTSCFKLEFKILGICLRSINQYSIIDMHKRWFSSYLFENIQIQECSPAISTIKYLECLPNQTLSQQKLISINNEQNSPISENKQNLILSRFSTVSFEKNEIERNSRYLIHSMYFDNTSKTQSYENCANYEHDEHEYESMKKKFKDEINLDRTIDYIADQVMKVDVNPFSLDLMEAILQKMEFYSHIERLESCALTEKIVRLQKGTKISINKLVIEIINTIGKGAYGTVFRGKEVYTGKWFAIKQEKPANLWEYFICLELRNRILNVNILCGFMDIEYALIGNNASVLLTELSPYGSLIDVCNKIKSVTSKNMDEYVVMVLISQILVIIDHLHASEIIHADIKPENILLMRKLTYGSKTLSIQLIDFGVSIDLQQFPKGQQFTFAYTNQEFQCVEMRENRPWSFQIDLYGVAATIHVLLFGKYMEIHKLPRAWTLKHHMPRYLNKSIWDKIFSELLNIRDENSMPNLQDLRALLEQEILEKEKYVKDKISEFNKAIDSL